MNFQGYRGYISTRMMERSVPQNVQQQVIRSYCEHNSFTFLLSATEYYDGFLILQSCLQEDIEGIVFYSIFQLPEDGSQRRTIFTSAILQSKELHFAAEGIRLKHGKEFDKLEDIFLLRSILCKK